MYYVYKHFDINDEIIYIGITNNIERRITEHIEDDKGHTPAEHKRSMHRIEFSVVANRAEAEFMETYLINKYKPKFNKAKNRTKECITIQMKEPDWIPVALVK